MPIISGTALGLIAALAAGAGAIGVGANENQKYVKYGKPISTKGGKNVFDTSKIIAPHKWTGWANDMFGNISSSNQELAQWFRSQAGDNAYLRSLSDAELGAILNQYYYKQGGALGNYQYDFDLKSALQDLGAIENIDFENMPQAPDYDAIDLKAANAIAAENAQINAIYDRDLARQTAAYQQNLEDNNLAYNDYARQILSNDYQKNAQLMGGLSNSLDRARTSALEAGASAGLRLSNNINTLLSTQNKQAQQSLETANNLAGQMLNQRQAAAGIRSAYNNTLSNDAQNRANLISGTAERTTAYQNNLTNKYQNDYNNKMTAWENAHSSYASNPYYGSYMAYNQNNMYNNNKNKQGGAQ